MPIARARSTQVGSSTVQRATFKPASLALSTRLWRARRWCNARYDAPIAVARLITFRSVNTGCVEREGSKSAAVLTSASSCLTTASAASLKHSTITRSLKPYSLINQEHSCASGVYSSTESHFISKQRVRLFDSNNVNNSRRLGTVSFANDPGGRFFLRANQLPTSTFLISDELKSATR